MASEPQLGDIILFYRARGLNRLITWFAGSPFFHVAIYAGQGNVIEADTMLFSERELPSIAPWHFARLPSPK